jgi:alpha-ketoglutarate-dependent taurine dioxygenase
VSSTEVVRSNDYVVQPVSNVLGAEVVGLDVSEPLDVGTLAVIGQAFIDHHLLVFPGSVTIRCGAGRFFEAVWATGSLPGS